MLLKHAFLYLYYLTVNEDAVEVEVRGVVVICFQTLD